MPPPFWTRSKIYVIFLFIKILWIFQVKALALCMVFFALLYGFFV